MKINKQTFSGIIVPLITPFYKNEVDFDSLKKLADYYVEHKADAFVVCGTTGEPATLNKDEKKSVIDFMIKNYSQKLPVIVGISTPDTAVAVNEAKALQNSGADGLLVLSPPYVKPSQKGIYAHYKHIAEGVSIPNIIYNIPHRTCVNVELNTIKALAKIKNIIGIKESAGDVNQLMNIIFETDLCVFTGEDHLLLITCLLGGHGAISAASHITLIEMKKIMADIAAGNSVEATELFKKTVKMIRLCFSEPNPAPIKAILVHQKLIRSDELRLPLIKASEAVLEKYAELGHATNVNSAS